MHAPVCVHMSSELHEVVYTKDGLDDEANMYVLLAKTMKAGVSTQPGKALQNTLQALL